MRPRLPELLAPAGNRDMIKAAIENGADAVYFGVQAFNARMRAENFAVSDLPAVMEDLHARGVKGYLTVNTLIFNDELDEAAKLLASAAVAGVDGVLVQDPGLVWIANRICPELEVHASTQMTVSSAESVAALERLGLKIKRVVAPRELSLRDLERFIRSSPVAVEAFVHGALCVAYSGQCLTSEALGGRSANRGECAQACRLPFDLIVDGEPRDLGDLSYLISPKDLAAYDDVPKLKELGVASIKIEGRLKSAEYVAAAVQVYRSMLDGEVSDGRPDRHSVRKLESTFTRGFTKGYLHGIDHQSVVEGRFPKKRGSYLGRVVAVSGKGVSIAPEGPLKPGDGVVFDAGTPVKEEEGGRVYELFLGKRRVDNVDAEPGRNTSPVLLTFERGKLDFSRISVGDRVWKTSDPAIDAELRASFEGEKVRYHRPVQAFVEGRVGKPLRVKLRDFDNLEVEVFDSLPAEHAHSRPLDYAVLWSALSRLGNTPFELKELTLQLEGKIMVPLSRLNELRRRAVKALLELRKEISCHRPVRQLGVDDIRADMPDCKSDLLSANGGTPVLSVLCRTLEQVEACIGASVETIYVDLEDPKQYGPARQLVPATLRFVPAALRVFKPGEGGLVRKLLQCRPDGLLVRSLGCLETVREVRPGLPLYGDYALNVANDLTARLLFGLGFRQLTPSFDLNSDQLKAMLELFDPRGFEIVVHQHMPLFHMEHCVFCRFLSQGTDASNCGRPCDRFKVELRDRKGYAHSLKADARCRNTLFNAVPQSASEYMFEFLRLGVQRYRIDLLLEDGCQTEELIRLYRAVLSGSISGRELWRTLRAESRLGVTRGSLDRWIGDRLYTLGA